MLDLGTSFLASLEREPNGLAVVDGDVRLSYATLYANISSLVASLDELGLKPTDHIVSVLQNRWQAATLHWACQFAGIILTPINWRSKADEIAFAVQDSEALAVFYEASSAEAVAAADLPPGVHEISLDGSDGAVSFNTMVSYSASS